MLKVPQKSKVKQSNSSSKQQHKPTTILVSQLKMNSNVKIPTLHEIIDEWKLQAHMQQKNLDKSLLPVGSSYEGVETYVQFLTQKIDSLQQILKSLTKRHIEVCSILQKELKRRDLKNQQLFKENCQISKELNTIMVQIKQAMKRHDIKGQSKISYKRLSFYRNKENQKPEQKIKHRLSPNEHQPKSLPRTQLSRLKHRTVGTETVHEQIEKTERKRRKKLSFQVKQEYYFKRDQKSKTNLMGQVHSKTRRLNSPDSRLKSRDN